MRRVRRFAAWLGILAILFAQAAVAVYACPGSAPPPAAAAAQPMPCGDMDPAAPNLCERHCHGQDQQPGTPAVALPAFFAAFQVTAARDADTPLAAHVVAPPRPAESPPLAFRHRFRL